MRSKMILRFCACCDKIKNLFYNNFCFCKENSVDVRSASPKDDDPIHRTGEKRRSMIARAPSASLAAVDMDVFDRRMGKAARSRLCRAFSSIERACAHTLPAFHFGVSMPGAALLSDDNVPPFPMHTHRNWPRIKERLFSGHFAADASLLSNPDCEANDVCVSSLSCVHSDITYTFISTK